MENKKNVDLNLAHSIRCKIFSGKPLHPLRDGAGDFAEVYRFWFESWNAVMERLDGSRLGPDQLLDRDAVISLWDAHGPVGIICATHYPNEFPWTGHPYFSMYSKGFLSALRDRGVLHLWGGQWVFVTERLSVKKVGVSFAAVLIGLLLKYCNEASRGASGSAMITMARADVPAAKLVRSWGGQLVNQVELHNVPCEELYCPDLSYPHNDPLVNDLTQKIWNSKEDYREEAFYDREKRAA